MRFLEFALIAILLVAQPTEAQIPRQLDMPSKRPASALTAQISNSRQAEARKLFGVIEQRILSSTPGFISSQFAQQVFVNMSGGESGYFSANQTVSILQRYFSSRSTLSFEFSRYHDAGSTPYATGRVSYVSRGRRESAQIYVSLRLQDSRWVISQFNIY